MKRTFTFLYIALALLLQGCKDDDDTALNIPLDIAQQSFEWDSNVNEQALQIKTSATWTATTDVDWCKPRKASGRGTSDLSLWVSPNITAKARSGVLTVRSGGKTRDIRISQPAYTADSAYTYRLPVIFHVLYNNSGDEEQNVRREWLATVLDSVNANYRRNDMNIQFELARIDQNGDTLDEAGIMRHQVDFSSMSCSSFLGSDNTKYGKLNQNFRQYINVFILTFDEEETMGISTLPFMPTSRKMDGLGDMNGSELQAIKTLGSPWGVAINNKYIYQDQKPGYIVPTYIVTTLSHELGHYLGLLHTFSEDECNEDDYCEDTKNCDYDAYIDALTEYFASLPPDGRPDAKVVLSRTNCEDGEKYYADNILDYMYTKADKMTADQEKRTCQVLNYCPMVPGPKLETYATRSSRSAEAGTIAEPRLSDCPPLPQAKGAGNGHGAMNVSEH